MWMWVDLGAVILLVALCGYILWEAWPRNPGEKGGDNQEEIETLPDVHVTPLRDQEAPFVVVQKRSIGNTAGSQSEGRE